MDPDKAFITKIDFGNNDGPWAFYVDVLLIVNTGTMARVAVLSSPSSTHPAGGWKPLVRDAVVAAALDQFDVVVDEVIFPDFSTLSV